MSEEEYDQDDGEFVYAERPNKTAIKREMLALRSMGKEMIEMLSPAQIEMLSISSRLKEEVIKAKGFKREALRRQLIFIEKLLRDEDADVLRAELDDLSRVDQAKVEVFHQLEEWRDRLLQGDDALAEALLADYALLERQPLRQFIRNAQKETAQNKPPKSSRALFRYLRDAVG